MKSKHGWLNVISTGLRVGYPPDGFVFSPVRVSQPPPFKVVCTDIQVRDFANGSEGFIWDRSVKPKKAAFFKAAFFGKGKKDEKIIFNDYLLKQLLCHFENYFCIFLSTT